MLVRVAGNWQTRQCECCVAIRAMIHYTQRGSREPLRGSARREFDRTRPSPYPFPLRPLSRGMRPRGHICDLIPSTQQTPRETRRPAQPLFRLAGRRVTQAHSVAGKAVSFGSEAPPFFRGPAFYGAGSHGWFTVVTDVQCIIAPVFRQGGQTGSEAAGYPPHPRIPRLRRAATPRTEYAGFSAPS